MRATRAQEVEDFRALARVQIGGASFCRETKVDVAFRLVTKTEALDVLVNLAKLLVTSVMLHFVLPFFAESV